MSLFSFNPEEGQIEELQKLPGNVSEHIRRAIREYLLKYFNVGTSPTKKEGDE